MRLKRFLILIVLIPVFSYAQSGGGSSAQQDPVASAPGMNSTIDEKPAAGNISFSQSISHLIKGAGESFEWYDIPVAGAYMMRKHLRPSLDERLRVSPFSFEVDLQRQLGHSGQISLGSMNKDVLPYGILVARLAYTIGADMFTGADITHEEYKHSFLFYKSLVYTYTLTELVKNFTHKERPDQSDSKSFFSGHSSTTFAAASFLYRETDDYIDALPSLKKNSQMRFLLKSLSFSALYGWASYVGYSRMHDNKHYLLDVAAGAAIGTLIGNMLYSSYFSTRSSKVDLSVSMTDDIPSISMTLRF